jgi:hypothetical protein
MDCIGAPQLGIMNSNIRRSALGFVLGLILGGGIASGAFMMRPSYQLLPHNGTMLKINSRTGDTWALVEGMRWVKLSTLTPPN